MRLTTLAATCLLGAVLTTTPAFAEVYKIGGYDVTIDYYPQISPKEEETDGHYAGGFYTVTSPELNGINASGQELDFALTDYAHMMHWKGFTGLTEIMNELPFVCSKITSLIKKDKAFHLTLAGFRGVDFQATTALMGDSLGFDHGNFVGISYLDTSVYAKQVLNITYGCSRGSDDDSH